MHKSTFEKRCLKARFKLQSASVALSVERKVVQTSKAYSCCGLYLKKKVRF